VCDSSNVGAVSEPTGPPLIRCNYLGETFADDVDTCEVAAPKADKYIDFEFEF